MKYVSKISLSGEVAYYAPSSNRPEYVEIYDDITKITERVYYNDLKNYIKSNTVYGITTRGTTDDIDTIWLTPFYALNLYEVIDFIEVKKNFKYTIEEINKFNNYKFFKLCEEVGFCKGSFKSLKQSHYTLFESDNRLGYSIRVNCHCLASYLVCYFSNKYKWVNIKITNNIIELKLFYETYYYKINDRAAFDKIISKAICLYAV